jgi:hypothetical protein
MKKAQIFMLDTLFKALKYFKTGDWVVANMSVVKEFPQTNDWARKTSEKRYDF